MVLEARTERRSTRQGVAVREALAGQDGFRSAQELHAALLTSGHKIGLATVYRHLQTLSHEGVADAIRTANGETTYRFCGESTQGHHHHHLVCRKCGRAEEVEGPTVERWAAEMGRKFGYVDVDHTIEVFGLCRVCAAA